MRREDRSGGIEQQFFGMIANDLKEKMERGNPFSIFV